MESLRLLLWPWRITLVWQLLLTLFILVRVTRFKLHDGGFTTLSFTCVICYVSLVLVLGTSHEQGSKPHPQNLKISGPKTSQDIHLPSNAWSNAHVFHLTKYGWDCPSASGTLCHPGRVSGESLSRWQSSFPTRISIPKTSFDFVNLFMTCPSFLGPSFHIFELFS